MARRKESKEMAAIRAVAALVVCGLGLMILSPNFAAMVERIMAIGLVVAVVVLIGRFVWQWRKTSSARARVDYPRHPGPAPEPYARRSVWHDADASLPGQSAGREENAAFPIRSYAPPIERPNPNIARAHEVRQAATSEPQNTGNSISAAGANADQIRRALRSLDWFQFEKLVTLYYRTQGYTVQRSGGAHPDGGVDLVVQHEGRRYVVQCKHWKKWTVGVRQMREFLGTMTAEKTADGIYITTRGYTNEARDFASKHGIVLFEESQLVQSILDLEARQLAEVRGLLADRRKFCPRCENLMVMRTARKGANAGGEFWGCSNYPRCKFILSLDDKE